MLTANEVKDVLRELGHASAKELAEYCGCSVPTIYNKIKEIDTAEPYKIVRTKDGYMWKETKNAEGYPDPTASMAIQNVAKQMMSNSLDEAFNPVAVGDVFEVVGSDKLKGEFLLIANDGQWVSLNVYRSVNDINLISLRDTDAKVDRRITTVSPRKYTLNKTETLSARDMAKVRKALVEWLGLGVNENAVKEAVNENAVKEAMQNSELVLLPKDDTELRMARQRAEIWEMAFRLMAGGKA